VKIATPYGLLKNSAVLVLALGAQQLASAGAIPYPNVGTPNPVSYVFTAATTGDVVAYFAGSGASYNEQLGLLDNGVLTAAGFGLEDHTSSVGQSFDFGHVTAGDSLVFVLDVTSPALGDVYSDPSMNTSYDTNGTDGHNHVYSTAYTAGGGLNPSIPTGTYVGFEDLQFPNSDFNYFDETYVFTNVTTSTGAVPEPASLGLLAGALICMALIRQRMKPVSVLQQDHFCN
jgi:PEP-CTERM motif